GSSRARVDTPERPDRDGLAPAWRVLPAPSFGPYRPPVAALDSRRSRILAIGPDLYAEDYQSARVWSLPLDGKFGWSEVLASGPTPFPRGSYSAIFDPLRDRILVFGGAFQVLFNDVWELSLSGRPAWSRLHVSGVAPSARYGQVAIYDSVGDAMVVWGGVDSLDHRNDA